jgi:hypothetical protein
MPLINTEIRVDANQTKKNKKYLAEKEINEMELASISKILQYVQNLFIWHHNLK